MSWKVRRRAASSTLSCGETETTFVIITSRAVAEAPWISLEHLLPEEHASTDRIDSKVATIGRALECEVRLHSASASRRHAQIELRDDGWVLVPMEGRKVLVDDTPLDGELLLENGMRLSFGDDVIVVADQSDSQGDGAAASAGVRWQIVVPAAIGGGIVLFLVLRTLGLL